MSVSKFLRTENSFGSTFSGTLTPPPPPRIHPGSTPGGMGSGTGWGRGRGWDRGWGRGQGWGHRDWGTGAGAGAGGRDGGGGGGEAGTGAGAGGRDGATGNGAGWGQERGRGRKRALADRLSPGRWFPPGTPVSSTRQLISSSSFHRLDMTLAVAEALTPNNPIIQSQPSALSTAMWDTATAVEELEGGRGVATPSLESFFSIQLQFNRPPPLSAPPRWRELDPPLH